MTRNKFLTPVEPSRVPCLEFKNRPWARGQFLAVIHWREITLGNFGKKRWRKRYHRQMGKKRKSAFLSRCYLVCVSYNQKEVMMQRCGANCLSRGTQCIGPWGAAFEVQEEGAWLGGEWAWGPGGRTEICHGCSKESISNSGYDACQLLKKMM